MKRSLHSIAVVTFAVLLFAYLASARDDARKEDKAPPKHAGEVEAEGLMVKRSEIIKKEPAADLGVARVWIVEKGKDVQSLLVELNGTLPMHFHPDGVHRMYVVEGKLRMTIGKEKMDMEAGDYM